MDALTYAHNAVARPDQFFQTFCFNGSDFGVVLLAPLFFPIIMHLALVCWCLYFRFRGEATFLTVGVLLNTLVCFGIKLMLKFPAMHPACNDTFGIVEYSLPSWPCQSTVFSVSYVYMVFVRRETIPREYKVKTFLLVFITILMVVASILSGYSSPIDVTIGCLFGGFMSGLYLFHFGVVSLSKSSTVNAMLAHIAQTDSRKREFRKENELVVDKKDGKSFFVKRQDLVSSRMHHQAPDSKDLQRETDKQVAKAEGKKKKKDQDVDPAVKARLKRSVADTTY